MGLSSALLSPAPEIKLETPATGSHSMTSPPALPPLRAHTVCPQTLLMALTNQSSISLKMKVKVFFLFSLSMVSRGKGHGQRQLLFAAQLSESHLSVLFLERPSLSPGK